MEERGIRGLFSPDLSLMLKENKVSTAAVCSALLCWAGLLCWAEVMSQYLYMYQE
jgi:hypothetical protein